MNGFLKVVLPISISLRLGPTLAKKRRMMFWERDSTVLLTYVLKTEIMIVIIGFRPTVQINVHATITVPHRELELGCFLFLSVSLCNNVYESHVCIGLRWILEIGDPKHI